MFSSQKNLSQTLTPVGLLVPEQGGPGQNDRWDHQEPLLTQHNPWSPTRSKTRRRAGDRWSVSAMDVPPMAAHLPSYTHSCRLPLIQPQIQACGGFGEEESKSEGERRESSKQAVKHRLEGKTRGQAFRAVLPCSRVGAPGRPPPVTPQALALASPRQAGQNQVALPRGLTGERW